jgi:hypothetical protein
MLCREESRIYFNRTQYGLVWNAHGMVLRLQ